MKYYTFTEMNDNEVETWNFYLPLTDEQFKKMQDAQNIFDEYDYECYYFDEDEVLENEVNILVKFAKNNGYMPDHTKVTNINWNAIDKFLEIRDPYEYDPFYKGQCWR